MSKGWKYIGLIVAVLLSVSAQGQEYLLSDPTFKRWADSSKVMRFSISYEVNKAHINENYMNNKFTMDRIRAYLSKSPRIDSMVIYSFSSPEGRYEYNERLSQKRGIAAKEFILNNVPNGRDFDADLIHLRPEAENWEGLHEIVRQNYYRSDRMRVLEVFESDLHPEEKKAVLKTLDRGRSWRYILESFMPRLRFAQWVCVWMPLPEEMPVVKRVDGLDIGRVTFREEPRDLPSVELMPVSLPPHPDPMRKTIFALKSNLLYDAISWLNFAVEVPFGGNKFSALYEHQFPWWRWGENNNKFCMRYLQMSGEFRWWFHPRTKPSTRHEIVRDRLSGHYLGVYGMGGKYDFQRNRSICYQGEFWSGGLSYGYSMPIGKRLNLEFSISLGYASIVYRHFFPADDFHELYRDPNDVGTLDYFGVTKLGVSLVFPIMKTIRAGKKGGAR